MDVIDMMCELAADPDYQTNARLNRIASSAADHARAVGGDAEIAKRVGVWLGFVGEAVGEIAVPVVKSDEQVRSVADAWLAAHHDLSLAVDSGFGLPWYPEGDSLVERLLAASRNDRTRAFGENDRTAVGAFLRQHVQRVLLPRCGEEFADRFVGMVSGLALGLVVIGRTRDAGATKCVSTLLECYTLTWQFAALLVEGGVALRLGSMR